jgi:hypothetical protein
VSTEEILYLPAHLARIITARPGISSQAETIKSCCRIISGFVLEAGKFEKVSWS